MERLQKSLYRKLSPVRLYLDDVRNIYRILAENCENIIIKTEEYQFSDINLLDHLESEQIHELEFEANRPYTRIFFRKFEVTIFIRVDSINSRGLLNTLEDVLNNCYRQIARILTHDWFPFVLSAIFSAILITCIALIEPPTIWVIMSLIAVIYIFIAIYGFRLSTQRYSTIIFSERRKRKNFFARNWEQLLVGILIAIITAALTFFLTKLAQ